MKKSGASQQQYEAISEVKEASNGIDETQLLDNMLPSSVSPGLASKQTGKQASCTQVLANQSKQEASPTVFQASIADATLNATKVVPVQVKKGGNTLSVSKAKPGGTQPLVHASSHENLFHFFDVEDRFQQFMPLSGKTTNAVDINVLDVSELLARFAHPNRKNPQINPTNHAPAKIEQQHFHQSNSERSAAFYSEYCPIPSFDLGIDDLPTTCVDDRAHQNDGSSGFAEHEFKELCVPMHPTIEIIDDHYVLDLEGIDEPCAEAVCSVGIITE
ncbi:hypothetical protein D1007_35401 [Hordeum vulgare]|nr:hypothetical protein D1007_35401 [Hordeum vulgare]